MKDLFKPEDFTYTISRYIPEIIAKQANEKLNKLIESWPVVYGKGNQWDRTDGKPDSYVGCTHQAHLAFIEELPKGPCKHEPAIVFNSNGTPKCKHCGVELQAIWTEVKR